ncbi:MAG: SMC-Scp complex subunit ScpB [Candidatus Eisenbacteria bacterium]
MKDLVRIIEALLFVADGPLSGEQIQEAVPEASQVEVEEALAELRTTMGDGDRGVSLYSVGGGSQILTRPEFSPWVERLLAGRRRQRLSRAALEVLAIVAYRQPATRGEIETIRGVDCGATLHTLLERKLIAIKGRAKAVGHPLLYATSATFLEHFGLDDLRGLPKLEEFAALLDREEARAELRRSGLLPEAGGAAKSIEDLPGGELLPATEDTRDWSCDGSA